MFFGDRAIDIREIYLPSTADSLLRSLLSRQQQNGLNDFTSFHVV